MYSCLYRRCDVFLHSKPYASKLPAQVCLEKIAVSDACMPRRCNFRCAPQYLLIHHKFAIVFSNGTRSFCKTGIRQIAAPRPFPAFAPAELRCRGFPLKFGWQAHPFPRSIGISLIVTDMAYRLPFLNRFQTFESIIVPLAIDQMPVEG